MSDQSAPTFTTISYSYQMRGELPGNVGLFYQDAGLGREAFETARRDLPGKTFPREITPNAAHADGSSTAHYRTPRHVLPDPHPSFAAPNRKLRDETWFQQLRTRDDGAVITKEEFIAARKGATPPRARKRTR